MLQVTRYKFMRYVQVVPVANIPFGKNQFFTYQTSEEKIKIGQEVLVPFRSLALRGVVWGFTEKPRFKTREVDKIVREETVLGKNERKLALWMSQYYYCSLGLVIKLMLPPQVKKGKDILFPRKIRDVKVKLTANQSKVLKTILNSRKSKMLEAKVFLLHGVTGSGKTEIYLRLCNYILNQGKQVIILVPEISLTQQAIDRFSARFPGKIAVVHSRLTKGERLGAWDRIRSGKAQIVIGPRSAIFAPARNLGLIVLDEEHDPSFKQYDQNPRYHARTVALELGRLTHSKVILGSATPLVESYYEALKGTFQLLELPQRINKEKMPEVEIVDMRGNFQKGSRSILSQKMKEELNKILVQKKQAILFVNRRGAASFVFCRDCGYTLKCPHCDVSLTYHMSGSSRLLCHYCGYNVSPPAFCPNCKSPYVRYGGLGTERVEDEIKTFFPKARTARFDRDATARKDAHQNLYYDFSNHKIDILIGTQMLAQGWDLPKVALIGIIAADADLNLPDFRSSERTFQLLTQVAGRTGRGKERGKVILQTYNPDIFVIQASAQHDYKLFFKQELKMREELAFPPFSKIVKLIYQNYKKDKAEKESSRLARIFRNYIKKNKLALTILGPAPTFIPRIRRRYRYHLILMFPPEEWAKKSQVLGLAPVDWIIDVEPESLL
ncbi:MAG: primosomal protein N' [Candidatus Doudnabacteria bacterium]